LKTTEVKLRAVGTRREIGGNGSRRISRIFQANLRTWAVFILTFYGFEHLTEVAMINLKSARVS